MEGDTLRHKTCRTCHQTRPIDEFNTRGNKTRHLHHSQCKSCSAERTRRYREKNVEARLWSSAKMRAKTLGLPFNLDVSDIIVPSHCPVLGILIDPSYRRRSENSPSIDRAIPSLGYVSGNVVVISWRANRLKSDASVDELRRIASYYEQFIQQVGVPHAANDNRVVPQSVARRAA